MHMTIAVYGRKAEAGNLPAILELLEKLHATGCSILLFESYARLLRTRLNIQLDYPLFHSHEDLKGRADFLISIGGDGTLLSSVPLVRDSGIPIIGVNIGRLGFLSSVSKNEISDAIDRILKGNFFLDKRSVLEVHTSNGLFEVSPYALNDLTVTKTDTSSMISVEMQVNGKYFSTYWADGLIISTPTGSTAYNLSCGGPVISPQCNSFVITPIAPHNLNVRPIVIDDSSEIELRVKSRSNKFLISVDSQFENMDNEEIIYVKKAPFLINILRMTEADYLNTLRTKLLWGSDARNSTKFAQ